MRRRSTYYGKSCSIVHTFVHSQCLEWSESLVVIHCQYTVKMGKVTGTHKAVGRIRAVTQHTFFSQFFNGRNNYLLFLRPQQTVVTGMRIQRKYGNARRSYAKVLLQRAVEDRQLLLYQFLGKRRCNLPYRNMPGHQCHPEIVFHQNHQSLPAIAQLLFNILRMAGERKLFRLYGMFVDRSSDNNVNQSCLVFLNRFLQSAKCGLASLRVGFGELNLHFIIRTVHNTQTIRRSLGRRIYNTEIRRQVQ